MNRSDLDRLRDARVYAGHTKANAGGLSAEGLAVSLQPQHAALFDLVVIGETLNRVSAEVKSAGHDIEWRLISDLRNLIVHAYWQIDFRIIADVVRDRLDPLMTKLDALIAIVERTDR
jgi:uncharacterized protein with HEPN domain